jgi:hypothetical protein
MIQIEKHYEENTQVAPFQFVKIGLTVKSDKELKTPEEIQTHSNNLMNLAKTLVRQELQQIKDEKGETHE